VCKLRARKQWNLPSIPGRGKISFSSPTQSPTQRVQATLSPGIKRPGIEADDSHTNSGDTKNAYIKPQLLHTPS